MAAIVLLVSLGRGIFFYDKKAWANLLRINHNLWPVSGIWSCRLLRHGVPGLFKLIHVISKPAEISILPNVITRTLFKDCLTSSMSFLAKRG